jgi:F-type H+-transporting ATPase subunit alpha
MTGKTVTFQNGSTATIIAQRPPIAFAACNFNSWDSTNNISTINAKNNISDSTKSTNNNINKLLDQIRIPLISVLDTSTAISVSNDIIGQIVDCYLQPISHYQHLSNTPNQSNPDTNTNIHTKRNIFAPIPQVKDISLINSPLLTGLAMVDALAPIGKGQNMLIIGKDTGIGQRDILISTIQTQLNRNNSKKLKCIYALTSHDPSVKEMVLQKLKDANVLDQIVVVTTRSSNTNNHNDTAATNASSTSQNMDNNAVLAAEAILVSSTACSIGEAFALSQGEDSLVIIDDIDQHKSFWDWTTRVLVDIWGVDSVVKSDREGGASSEMRAFYSNLIQRAARFNKKNGDGSVTLSLITNLPGALGGSGGDSEDDVVFSPSDFELSAEKVKQRISILVDKKIPLTPANLRKIQIPVPKSSESERKRRLALQHVDDLISMSDGQIWLDENLYEKGQRPALDPQRSITRVGIGADTDSRADAPAISALAGGLRFEFAQAASLDGAGVNSGADKQILKRDALLLAMHQESEIGGRLLSENCVALLAALKGYLNGVIQKGGLAGTESGKQEIDGLLSYVWQSAPDVMKSIDESLDLTSDTRSELESILKDYFANK